MTGSIRSVCVFCGSSTGRQPEYAAAAGAMGQLLAERRIRLVYGGGKVGLMGALADAALAAGGQVVGVIPRMLVEKELAHGGLTELRIVSTMHERKALMAEISDAFIALPGGLGTFEELCEVLTWAQLGIHARPIGCLNVRGYFTPFRLLLDQCIAEGFLQPEQRRLFLEADEPRTLLDLLEHHLLPPVRQWLNQEQI
jgi:uncharacterized protein (TIGR00730 family)